MTKENKTVEKLGKMRSMEAPDDLGCRGAFREDQWRRSSG
jgi:hypothetical protein